ncbi:MAG: DUF2520 domain-containing protein [Thermoanaerobaculia bacterium]
MTTGNRPLAGLRLALVGAGAVGGNLARWFAVRGAVVATVTARPGSRRAAALVAELGATPQAVDELASAACDLLLLAVPDEEIAPLAGRLADRPQAAVALHVAGALDASVLAPLAAAGSAAGTFHPLLAFSGLAASADPEPGIFFALDGDQAAVELGRRLAAALGGRAAIVSGPIRPLYHLVATLLAGGVTTVAAAAFEIARAAKLPEEASDGFRQLSTRALAGALAAAEPAAGITGPAARGDLATFRTEARTLDSTSPAALPIVLALARESLRQRARVAPETPAQQRLREALERPDLLDRTGDRVLTFPPGRHG